MIRFSRLLLFLALTTPALAQAPSPSSSPSPTPSPLPRLISPEVHPDRRVTFRFRSPYAQQVEVRREAGKRIPMQKDASGIWTATTDPLAPDIYGYAFVVDGAEVLDPSNAAVIPNLLNKSSLLHVAGPPAETPWDPTDTPRGILHHHFYKSAVVGDERDFYVYTPPGYDPHESKKYPALYLLHGYSDDASAWTAMGRAHVILDNLIASGKAKPMLLVMPLGYGDPEFVTGYGVFANVPLRKRNYDRFREALLTEVIPAVESAYRAAPDRESRAITGLSMGGAESLLVGLNALDRFAWVGSFSAGGFGRLDEDLAPVFPGLDASANERLRLLWVACGTEDGLLEVNRRVRHFLDARGVKHTAVETPGAHTWMVWRRYLATFAPMLF
jgi:enterochelin esterase-like enzyme